MEGSVRGLFRDISRRLSREGLLTHLCGAGKIGNTVLVQLVLVLDL